MGIKELRALTGLSQSKFANKYNIPVRTLQQWEQGVSTPPEYVTDLIEQAVAGNFQSEKKSFITKFKLTKAIKWRAVTGIDFKNCTLVHPLQQRKVSKLIEDMASDENVKKIIVFGSSVTTRCHIGSDVDIYAEMSRDENPIRQTHDFECDFWNNFRVDERLRKEILGKGVVVYER